MFDSKLLQICETAAKSRLAEVIDARTQLRDAVQSSNQANVYYWEDRLIERQAALREWEQRAQWARGGK